MEKSKHENTDKSKKRRIMLMVERIKEAQHHKEWSRKHGHDTVMMKMVTAQAQEKKGKQKGTKTG